MLLKQLYDFAESRRLFDHLAFKRDTPVRWIIYLDSQGDLIGTGPQETQGGERNRGKEYDVPKTNRATGSGQVADFLADDIGAVFGLNAKPDKEMTPRAVANLQAKHDDFWRQIKEAERTTQNPTFKALLQFRDKLAGSAPGFLRLDETESPKWLVRGLSDGEVRLGNDLFTFAVGDNILICDEAIREYWRQAHAKEMADEGGSAQIGVCLIIGETGVPIARTHTPMVTGLRKPARGTGAGIVGADKPAFWSYGLQKGNAREDDNGVGNQRDKNPGYLSPCSIRASKGYLLALQYLSSCEDHWLWLGPAWLCFWAAETEPVSGLFARLLRRPDPLTIRKFMASPWGGLQKAPPDSDTFFAVTLTAAGPRVVVKDWIQIPLAEAARNFKRWFGDLTIGSGPDESKATGSSDSEHFAQLAISRLAGATTSLTLKAGRLAPDYDKLQPDVAAELYRAALKGSAPSVSLIKPILDQLRSRFVRDENYQLLYDQSRFALLKLIINRNRKDDSMEIKSELIADTADAAYNCGRLLAIIAATQDKAHDYKLEGPGVAERYFGTASVSPGSVFPLLCRLNRHHLNKIAKSERFAGHERFIEEQIQAVCALFKPAKPGLPPMFPRTLDLQAQGRFALGFYQQAAADAEARRSGGNKKDKNPGPESKIE